MSEHVCVLSLEICTDERSRWVHSPVCQIYTTRIRLPSLHRCLQYCRLPPRGALKLWLLVRHIVYPFLPTPPLSLLSLGSKSLSPHLILSASFYPAQSWQIHRFCGERQQIYTCRGRGRVRETAGLVRAHRLYLFWSLLMQT